MTHSYQVVTCCEGLVPIVHSVKCTKCESAFTYLVLAFFLCSVYVCRGKYQGKNFACSVNVHVFVAVY